MHGGVEEAVAALTLALGSVHGGVGIAQQLVGAFALALGQADAQAGGNEDLPTREGKRWGQDVDDALCQAIGSVGFLQVLEQDGELVAAQTGRGVAGSQAALQAGGHRDEQLVADRVAQAVIDGLEPVEVQQQDRDRRGVSFLTTHGVVHAVGEERPVGQVGQRVVEGLMAQLGLEGVPVGHVLHRDQDRVVRVERELMGAHLDVDDASVLQAMPPPALLECAPLARDIRQETGHVFGRPDVGDPSSEELLPCVAVVADGRLVHLEELECLRVKDPHRLGVVREELAEARLARAQLRIGCLLRSRLRPEEVDDEGHTKGGQHSQAVDVRSRDVGRRDPSRDGNLTARHAQERPAEGGTPGAGADLFEIAGQDEEIAEGERRAPTDRIDDHGGTDHLNGHERLELARTGVVPPPVGSPLAGR